jgi:pyruvate dehydrogenase phosphatase
MQGIGEENDQHSTINPMLSLNVMPLKWRDVAVHFKRVEDELIRNNIKNRVSVSCYNANMPIEDVYNAIQLRNVDGYYLTVLDGHGGDDLANYANKRIHVLLDNYMKDNLETPVEKRFENVLNKVYKEVEEEYLEYALREWEKGNGRLAFLGTCVITVVVSDDSLYIANLGDSKARLFRRNGDKIEPIKISKTYNANKLSERIRLQNKYSKEKDIVVINENKKTYYVKGRLAPTKVRVIL